MLSLKKAVVAAFGALFLAAPAQSAEYPVQKITVIVNFPDLVLQQELVRGNLVEVGRAAKWLLGMKNPCPFRYFKASQENIRLAAMLYVRFPPSPAFPP